MYIFKETYDGPDFEYYKKEYNDKGLLTFEDRGAYGFWVKKEITYDNSDRIIKIKETQIGHRENNREDILLHIYEYTGSNYRVVTYKTHKRDIYDINTYENLVLGVEKWHVIDEIFSIREYKFIDGNLVSERNANIENGERSSLLYTYKDNRIATETKTNTDNNIEKINYLYENNLLKSKEAYFNNSFVNKTIYLYKNGLVDEEQTIHKCGTLEYVAFTINYFYNSKNELIKRDYYGRFNSKMYLYKIEEFSKTDNIVTQKSSSISNHEAYTGYFDLNALNEVNYKQFEASNFTDSEANAVSVVDTLHNEYNTIGEDFFDTLPFDNNCLVIETYDHKNNLVEYKYLDPVNQDVMERLIYHHEYNDEGLLELSLCFKIVDTCEIEKRSVKRFYYRD